MAFGYTEGDFLPFFAYFFHITSELYNKGGGFMDEDEYVFDMFLEVMERMEKDDADGRLRMLSKDPRFIADDPDQVKPNKKHIEKR